MKKEEGADLCSAIFALLMCLIAVYGEAEWSCQCKHSQAEQRRRSGALRICLSRWRVRAFLRLARVSEGRSQWVENEHVGMSMIDNKHHERVGDTYPLLNAHPRVMCFMWCLSSSLNSLVCVSVCLSFCVCVCVCLSVCLSVSPPLLPSSPHIFFRPCRYFKGKRLADQAVSSYFGGAGVILRPGFVHGVRKVSK